MLCLFIYPSIYLSIIIIIGDAKLFFGKECVITCYSHASTMDAFLITAAIPVKAIFIVRDSVMMIVMIVIIVMSMMIIMMIMLVMMIIIIVMLVIMVVKMIMFMIHPFIHLPIHIYPLLIYLSISTYISTHLYVYLSYHHRVRQSYSLFPSSHGLCYHLEV